jgi:hypothetical protein
MWLFNPIKWLIQGFCWLFTGGNKVPWVVKDTLRLPEKVYNVELEFCIRRVIGKSEKQLTKALEKVVGKNCEKIINTYGLIDLTKRNPISEDCWGVHCQPTSFIELWEELLDGDSVYVLLESIPEDSLLFDDHDNVTRSFEEIYSNFLEERKGYELIQDLPHVIKAISGKCGNCRSNLASNPRYYSVNMDQRCVSCRFCGGVVTLLDEGSVTAKKNENENSVDTEFEALKASNRGGW